ncbi:uncharacterized protein RHIMIDRAFT_256168 [Rhizopus microsporus ATCC 52813]|uniref:Uncharacterized protein n=1 Tax=Rhizopus microsporus ATCC 52813 TaxID=1340429 RepID=A0A2G4SSN5_RHIZD|nr:uncharacterized protein RHIMIDRAFT_256168 [Rhizopus microsporus ATCC 52813]PHZ11761.1 hypothetical protein RHIMIDRAFT_256168 [Rhizopus microsporus ATCC 52813]
MELRIVFYLYVAILWSICANALVATVCKFEKPSKNSRNTDMYCCIYDNGNQACGSSGTSEDLHRHIDVLDWGIEWIRKGEKESCRQIGRLNWFVGNMHL